MLYCEDLLNLGLVDDSCCSSCHEEWYEGYGYTITVCYNHEEVAEVCCSLANNMSDHIEEFLR